MQYFILPSRNGERSDSLDTCIRIGARASALSLCQVHEVRARLLAAWPGLEVEIVEFTTSGDILLDTPLPLLGGKGVFTQEIETALREGVIDLAVHSLKDLPVAPPDGLCIGAIPFRASVDDVLIAPSGLGLESLLQGAVVGTSSVRRAAQLRRIRPDIRPVSIRGNVETRLRKLFAADSEFAAIVLARAGLDRLGKSHLGNVLPLDVMLPAPGQGALAVQCLETADARSLLAPIHDRPSAIATTAERAFLAELGGGCAAPVAAYGWFEGSVLTLRGRVISPDGATSVDIHSQNRCDDEGQALELGRFLAEKAQAQGADVILGQTP